MTKNSINTEENILVVAKKVFVKNGYDGTSMQMIADAAGINKSLLHYYYRSKEKLFRKIFSEAFIQFIPRIGEIFKSEMKLEEKIHAFAENYIEVFIEHPLIPIFVMQELSKNPQQLADLIKGMGVDPGQMFGIIMNSIEEEGYQIKDPRQFMVNLIGLCVFPFAARPLIQRMMFENDDAAYETFLQERKKEVPEFIINAIKKG